MSCGRARAEDAASLLRDADAAFAKRTDPVQDKIALITYQRAAAMDPKVALEANWKASRAAWWVGKQSETRDEKLQYFQEGIDLGEKTIAISSDSVEGHFYLGINLGSYGESKGVLKSLSMVKPIRREMAEVLRLNENYLNGGAYRVLGAVDYKVPGIMGGNRKRAGEELQKALSMGPLDPFAHYYLAEYYKLVGEKEKSQSELQTLKTLQVPAENQPELLMAQKEAEQKL